jgi:hypothetical protein
MKIRIKYFVYPEFQGALLLANVLINLFLFTFLSVRVKLFFNSLLSAGGSAGLSEGHPYYQFINLQKSSLKIEFAIAIFVSLVLTSGLTLWLSHKLAGPLLRLREHLKTTAKNGVYRNLKFRERDYFQDLPTHLNQAMESVIKHEHK